MEKTFLDLLPKTKELLEKLKDKPTTEERVAALEAAIAELALKED